MTRCDATVFPADLKRAVRATPDLSAEVERQLERAALDALGIVHKAGRVATGFARTESEVAGGPVAAILQATDASPDGVRKIAAAAARRQAGTNAAPIPVVTAFTTAQLDLALGRSNVVACCPARRPSEQRVPRALPEPRTLPDHRSGRTRRGIVRRFTIFRMCSGSDVNGY